MEANNSILINRFFTRNTFNEIIKDGGCKTYSDVLDLYVQDCLGKRNSDCIQEVYCFLKKNYPNEYYYKNTLLNKLLLGIHSINTTTALTEIPIASSKADFVLINGKAVVYEIKTPLDNFNRLKGQLNDYYKAFSRVVVVTGEEEADELDYLLCDYPVGLYVLTKRGTICVIKEPVEYRKKLSNNIIFSIMRKTEYESVISSVTSLPETTPCRYYRACESIFDGIDIDTAYDLFVKQLKKRVRLKSEYFFDIPYELKFLAYFSDYTIKEYQKLNAFLNSYWR